MSAIYVITADDIEDHWPSLAFSTLDKAESYIKTHTHNYRYIQPVELDTGVESKYEDAIFDDEAEVE